MTATGVALPVIKSTLVAVAPRSIGQRYYRQALVKVASQKDRNPVPCCGHEVRVAICRRAAHGTRIWLGPLQQLADGQCCCVLRHRWRGKAAENDNDRDDARRDVSQKVLSGHG